MQFLSVRNIIYVYINTYVCIYSYIIYLDIFICINTFMYFIHVSIYPVLGEFVPSIY